MKKQNDNSNIATVYIGIGANLQNPIKQLKQALDTLNTHPELKIIKTSSFYRSVPMGPQDQPDFINAVCQLETQLSPLALLDCLQTIEKQQGRVRKAERWGPRVLDLDILMYNQEEIHQERLIIPHYGLRERNFVILPLDEIAPNLQLPDGTLITSLAENIEKQGIERL